MSIPNKISGGVYLVIDPAMGLPYLLSRLDDALKGGLAAVQIWDNWLAGADKGSCITAISGLCRSYHVPLLIGNDWAALLTYPELDGVHFDTVPENYQEVRDRIGRPFSTGITCSGDLDIVEWAEANDVDYVSFCAMFPSSSSVSCSIVMPETVRQARELTCLPLFVSGGITPQNIPALRERTPFDGVAVISGIMKADDPEQQVTLYHNALNKDIQNEIKNDRYTLLPL